jgi:acyl-CoA reductase-like NAD-dependent aldehyde dehydrogenase
MSNFRLGLVLAALLLAIVAGQNHYFQPSEAQQATAAAICEPQSQACDDGLIVAANVKR